MKVKEPRHFFGRASGVVFHLQNLKSPNTLCCTVAVPLPFRLVAPGVWQYRIVYFYFQIRKIRIFPATFGKTSIYFNSCRCSAKNNYQLRFVFSLFIFRIIVMQILGKKKKVKENENTSNVRHML